MEASSQARWHAVYTRYKSEKWVAERLLRKGINAYVPLYSKRKRYQKRIATYHYPLISCYCFVKIDEEEKRLVLQTENVIGFVTLNGKASTIPEREIEILKRVTGERLEIDSSINCDHIGQEVEVIAGNLCGLKGSLLDIRGKREFVVALETLGVQLKISIDPVQLSLCRA